MPALEPPRLTIGMATFDDFDGVYFTITSLLLHHAEVLGECQILVVDNHPSSRQGRHVREWLGGHVPNARYVPFMGPEGTAQARNEIFRQARTEAVLCVDCHVLLVPGAVRKLIDYYRAHPACGDLLSGPLLHDSGRIAATHQRPQWSRGAWGVWDRDPRGDDIEGEPFEIWQQGMGLFSCHKQAWVGFHPEFRGFGGCESYIMEKFRRRGGRVLCCPWLRWTHRFRRPEGIPYSISRRDTRRNYVIGFRELGIDTRSVDEHFAALAHNRQQRSPAVARPAVDAAIVGDCRFGGVQMRGRALARHWAIPLLSPREALSMPHTGTIIAVKCGTAASSLRQKCDRLIYDPLDDFVDSPPSTEPAEYWRSKYRQLAFDDILATSPACYETMRSALPPGCRIHLVPHPCDSRVNESWRDPNGPIAYAGMDCFIESGLSRIHEACRRVGKDFVSGGTCEVLRGASLALALRLPPFNTSLNRHCKPQIKVENAAAAGLPVVTTDCPAARSLRSQVLAVRPDFTAEELAHAMRRALAGPPPAEAFREGHFLAAMDRVLNRDSVAVYTGVFGGYDALHAPRERQPGVQYVCFTDNPRLKSTAWGIRYCPPSGDPMLQAKRMKVLAHEMVDCDLSIWIDGNIELVSLNGVIEACKRDLALAPHPERDCIYAEAEHCRMARRGDPKRIEAAVSRYRAEGHPPAFGLWMGGIVVRKHTAAVARFNQAWWREIESGTTRDQISLPVVLRRLGLSVDSLPGSTPEYRLTAHLR